MKTLKTIILLLIVPTFINAQSRYSVVIDEIMADPTPSTGLPEKEWLELRNISTNPINLSGWKIGDASGESGSMSSFLLQPDSFVVVCPASSLTVMSAFGAAISVTNFPSLGNEDDLVFLQDMNGSIIHAVNYSSSWYRNELKKEGGWTLEMIDKAQPCAGANNWIGSSATMGGTPGRINAADGINNDLAIPHLKRAYTTDSITIVLVFDEPIDSLKGAIPGNYAIDRGVNTINASVPGPLFDKVILKMDHPLDNNKVYSIDGKNLADCSGNPISETALVRTGIPVDALPHDLVINEILFNPRSNGYDYVEVYNRSDKIIDAAHLFIANRNSTGDISSITALSAAPFYIFPGDYVVETEDEMNLEGQYLVKNPGEVLMLPSTPSFPDAAGDVIMLNKQGVVVDEVAYNDKWQFKLIDNDEGVALERVDPEGPSQDLSNWHSAASTAGYGTPTYKNSQLGPVDKSAATIDLKPKIFSPDNDGVDDITQVQFQVDQTGFVANVTVFDVAGRVVRNLVQNGTMGLKGYWNWDGLDDRGMRLAVGEYIVLTELFDLTGKKMRFKNVVILARRF